MFEMPLKTRQSHVRHSRVETLRPRKGAAIIELAVCLPLLVIVSLATIEACAMIFLKQTLAVAAFEGARTGLLPGSAPMNVEAQCALIMNDHSISTFSVAMQPSDPSALLDGDYFRVEVSAPCAPNSLIGGWFYAGQSLTESVELVYH